MLSNFFDLFVYLIQSVVSNLSDLILLLSSVALFSSFLALFSYFTRGRY